MRLGSLVSFFSFLIKDFWILGCILILLGLIYLFKHKKNIFWFCLINIFSLSFFIFYASYILVNDFMVATFERFLLLPYLMLTIIIGCGLKLVFTLLNKNLLIKSIFILVLLFYPIGNFWSNYKKLIILKHDATAENFSKNILDSVPINSILLLSTDTVLFDNQYYYYAYKYRPDIKLIHLFKLTQDYYWENLKKYFPDLSLKSEENQKNRMISFIQQNQDKFTIFAPADGDVIDKDFIWLPHGLLMQYFFKNEATPSATALKEVNNNLWLSYDNPLSGSLKQYKNLFLADILRVFATAHKKNADYLYEHQFYNDALAHFNEAIVLNKKDIEGYIGLGKSYLALGQCDKAEGSFNNALAINPKDVFTLAYLRKTYLDCFQDSQKAQDFENACLQQEESKQIKLKDL